MKNRSWADLPAVGAPAGFITQDAARDKAMAAMQNRQWGRTAAPYRSPLR